MGFIEKLNFFFVVVTRVVGKYFNIAISSFLFFATQATADDSKQQQTNGKPLLQKSLNYDVVS